MNAALRAHTRILIAIVLITLFGCGLAEAQNTSSVSGPAVSANEREVEYRLGWRPGEDGAADSFAHRFDYGFSLNGRRAIKVFANFDDGPSRDLRFDNLNAEYLIELSPENAPFWKTGIRFDARLSNGPDPERLGFNWLNQWQLTGRLRARAQFIATRQFGDAADDAIDFEVRSSLIWKAGGGYDLSLLSLANLGSSDDFGGRNHVQEIGPTLSGPLPNGYGWTIGTLLGVTDTAPDQDIRIWISKSF